VEMVERFLGISLVDRTDGQKRRIMDSRDEIAEQFPAELSTFIERRFTDHRIDRRRRPRNSANAH
jgi:hypothetical protein